MCARAMLNCGLSRLRLVAPRDGWPNPAATATAADADLVLAKAEVFDSVGAAVADCGRVYATTARNRARELPCLSAAEAAVDIAEPERTAILFGPEASGLSNTAIAHADRLLHFPTNPEFASLNLAQAVLLFGWEWRGRVLDESPQVVEPTTSVPADKAELSGFLDRLEQSLDDGGFFPAPDRRVDTVENLRAFFSRATPTEREIRLLHGVITALGRDRADN